MFITYLSNLKITHSNSLIPFIPHKKKETCTIQNSIICGLTSISLKQSYIMKDSSNRGRNNKFIVPLIFM